MNNNQNIYSFKLGHLNVRSLFTGFQTFSALMTDNNFDVFCVTETWLNENIPSDIVYIPNYNFFRKDRAGRGGGVGIYIRDGISCKVVFSDDFPPLEGLELLFLNVKIRNIILLICVIYRAPSSNLFNCVEYMDDVLSFISPQYENIIFLGDINVDQLGENCFGYCLSSYDFSQVISEPTRVTSSSAKLIDVIFINKPEFISNTGVINADLISDHQLVFCSLNITLQKPKPKEVTYRDFKNLSREHFLVDLNSIYWDNIFYINNIDDKVAYLTNNILSLFDNHAPYITSRITKSYAPWLTGNVKFLMKERNKALSKFKKTRHPLDWEYYRQLRNFTVNAIKNEKAAYLLHHQNNYDSKELWKAIRNLNIKNKQNNFIPEHLRTPDDVNNFFSSVFSPLNNCPETNTWYLSNKFNNNLSFSFKLATVEEVQTVISKLKSNAYGSDGICATMIQLCAGVICKYITHIINCALETGYFPQQWKRSLINPIPKNNNPLDFCDLRPITIIPTLSKVLEKIIQVQIYDYVTVNNIISPLQSGFRKGHSTTTVLTDMLDNILRSLDNGYATVLIFLDFSKAFDTIDHSLLCAKLRYYGFDNTSVNFFESYLNNRSQSVVMDNNCSNSCTITSGVPQGSVLGPILFLIYTADIFNSIQFCRIHCYADDSQLDYSFVPNDVNRACENINSDLDSLSAYSKNNNLKLNPNKCAFMLFCSNNIRNRLAAELNLKVYDHSLNIVNKMKNLGLFFENDLRFRDHVALLVKKSYVCLKLLYTNINIINFKLRKKLCETLVLPILNHGFIAYYPCLDKLTQYRLQKIQNSCCRFIYRLRKYDRVSSKILQLGWLKIDRLHEYHLSVFVHKLLATSSPPYLREKINFRYNMHNANLRFINLLSTPHHHTAMFRRSFSYNSVKIYNKISDDLKGLPVNSFRKKIKIYFLSLANIIL